MQDIWYADKRDLVKWATLLHLAQANQMKEIIQVAYYRKSTWPPIEVNGAAVPIPQVVLSHFRDVRRGVGPSTGFSVHVVDDEFNDRAAYTKAVVNRLAGHPTRPLLAFLDPDTGLASGKAGMEHVTDREARSIWDSLRAGDLLVFYQHKTNRNGSPWIDPKRQQLANALGLTLPDIGTARGPAIASDVVLFFALKR